MITNHDKAHILVQALPFIRKYADKTVVIKYGGAAMVDEKVRDEFMKDVALMKYVGIHPIIIHGGGPEINTMLKRVNKETEFIEGNRVSDAETVEIAEMVLSAKNLYFPMYLNNLPKVFLRFLGFCPPFFIPFFELLT